MVSYFIPISLLVLGGFALGLLVGWLAWSSPKSQHDQAEKEYRVPAESEEATSITSDPTIDHSAPDLPVWQMKEVRSRQRSAASMTTISPDDVDPGSRSEDTASQSPETVADVEPEQEAAEVGPGADPTDS